MHSNTIEMYFQADLLAYASLFNYVYIANVNIVCQT